MHKNILILSPHGDDAELGCGGTIHRFIREEENILWVVFSTAEESLPEGLQKNTLEVEFNQVMEKLGLTKEQYMIEQFKVRHLPSERQVILEKLMKIRHQFCPDIVIGPSLNDFHQDHQVVSNEMIRAFKSFCSIICYELPWNHIKFETQMFVKLEPEDIKKKIEILNCYKSQLSKKKCYFTSDFIKGLANTRGAQINVEYAEAFEVIRWIH